MVLLPAAQVPPITQRDIHEIPDFLFWTCMSKIRNTGISPMSRLAGKCATQKFKNFCSSSLLTCLNHMVI